MPTFPISPAPQGLRPSLDLRGPGERYTTKIDWLDSKHSFAFGHHYDPRNTSFGLLLVNNDDTVRPGAGFETHPHEDMEIVTWVLRGGLVPVASGMAKHDGAAAIRIKQKDAALHAARLEPGQSVTLPAAPYLHLYVARGAVELEGAGPLAAGAAARITAGDGQRVTATEPSEILAWEMHARLGMG